MAMETSTSDSLESVATGQRLMILAIFVNIVGYVLSRVEPNIGLLIALVGLSLGVGGMIRTTTGLGYSMARKVIYVIGLIVPLISLILLARVNTEATKVLRANGYKVGFFGAKST